MDGFRNLFYSIAMSLYMAFEFFALTKLTYWSFNKIDDFQTSLSNVQFFSILILIGCLTFFVLQAVIIYLSKKLITIITRIIPDRNYAVWFTRIYAIIFCSVFIFKTTSDSSSSKMIFVSVVMSILTVRMAYINILVTNENLLVKEFVKNAGVNEAHFRKEMNLVLHSKETKDNKETNDY